jgi:lipopolysaccharide transport system permease protein
MKSRHSTKPTSLFNSLFRNRELIWDLVKRDFIGRYKGSILGVLWSLFNPLLMLAIYTIVFSVAFKAKWGTGEESKITFAIVLFSGMIVHGLFAECLNRAPGLIVSQPNFVKKVIFPLDILPWVAFISAFLHFLVSFAVLVVFCLLAGISVHIGVLMIPIALGPLVLIIIGVSWIFASLGVYLRDLTQIMGMVTTVALFMAPIFYPVEALPQAYGRLLVLNPITLPVIQLRNLMLWEKPFLWGAWTISLAIGAAVCQIGYWWFQRTRHGFADVL